MRPIFAFVETWLFGYLRPSQVSPELGAVGDLTRSRAELIAKNVLLWHQLGILQRQVKRPQLTKGDRLGLMFWASRLRYWKQALLIVKPETLLRWHRKGFQLFWKLKNKTEQGRRQISDDTIELIRRMVRKNRLLGCVID